MNEQNASPINLPRRIFIPPPLSLYVHLPWCARRCPYCDFNAHRAPAKIPENEYIRALLRDVESALPLIWGRRIIAVFFGGGTPSLFSGEGMDELLCGLRARLPIAPDAEITMEANPGAIEAEKFAAFRAAGINRLSLGAQSFDDDKLAALGRIHNAADTHRAAELALMHFDNVNLDVMFGLPGQSLSDAINDAKIALGFSSPHLSFYHLTIEAGTPFAKTPPLLPDHDLASEMAIAIAEITGEGGYNRYEVSAFARPEFECRHNLNYWKFGDYLGIGAGAHSKLTIEERIHREIRHRTPADYINRAMENNAVAKSNEVSPHDIAFEFMLGALRLTQGFPIAEFTSRTGLGLNAVERPLAEAESLGLIARDLSHIRPTERGMNFLNDLQSLFLPASAHD